VVKLKQNDFITITGSLMVAVGAFMPMIDLKGLANVAYADAAEPEVYLLVALALAASGVIFASKRRFSLFAAIGAWLVMLWPVIKNIGGGDDGGLLGKVTNAVKDPLQQVTQKLFSNVFDFELGGFVFVGGMLVLLVGAVKNFKS
jgi:uncharacterized membrane protein YgdD (TMEM256/DUF423 family)